jgi:parallel beta-helix repeat protein
MADEETLNSHIQLSKARIKPVVSALLIILSFCFNPSLCAGQEKSAAQEKALEALGSTAASEPSPATPNYYPSKIRLSASGSTEKRGIFYIDYLLPLYYSQDQTTLLFFNPKQNLYTPSSEETNLGLGLRKIFNDSFILGMHFFFDRKLAHSDKFYSQVGAGLEFLSEPFDFRFNYYDPTTKAKVIDDNNYEFGSTTLVNVKSMEEPLGGYDFEFGFPVPFKKLNTRLYFGGFFFNSKLGKDNNGYRIRSETNLTNWFVLDLTFNSRNAQETEFIGGLRFTIPLELGRVVSKQNPFKTTPPGSYIKDRILERVVRDTDVQSQSAIKKDDVAGIDMLYVDNTNTTGTEDGSLEHPYNTLAEAFASGRYGVGKYVYVFAGDGTNTGYNSATGYTLADDVVLWGSKYNGGYQGLPVTTGYPMIGGTAAVKVPVTAIITLANNNTVMGLDIEYSSGVYPNGNGIYGLNKNGSSILYNNIANNAIYGIFVRNTSTGTVSDFTFTGNTMFGNSAGVLVRNQSTGVSSDFTFTDNTATGNSQNGIWIYNDTTGTVSDFTFTGNTVTGNSLSGISVRNNNSGIISDFSFSGNTTNGNIEDYGIVVTTIGGAISDFTFNNNTSTGNGGYGIELAVDGGGSMSGFSFNDNVFTGNSWYGLMVDTYASFAQVSDFTFTSNTVTDNLRHGIFLWIDPNVTASDFTFTDNVITGNTQNGVYLYNAGGTLSDLTFTGNTITGNIQNGVYLRRMAGSMSDINFGDGILGGNNSIYNNGIGTAYFDINNASGINPLLAQYNWWGSATPLDSQFNGPVDHSNPLSSLP